MLGNKQGQTFYKEITHGIKKQVFVNREVYANSIIIIMPCGIYVNNLSGWYFFETFYLKK